MAASYIDGTYVDSFIGNDAREALFTIPGGTYSATEFTQVVEAASDFVKSCCLAAGYSTIGDTTTDGVVMLATLAQFLLMAPPARKGYDVANKLVEQFGGLPSAIRAGTIPLPTLTPDPIMSVGAASFTSSNREDLNGVANGDVKPQIMRRLRTSW